VRYLVRGNLWDLFRVPLAAAASLGGMFLAGSPAFADGLLKWHFDPATGSCGGNCAIAIYGGQYVTTPMKSVFGVDDAKPFWDWKWDQHYILAGAFSRRILSIGGLDIEPEIGFAQRFGGMHEVEGWAAIYFRWTLFPWSDVIRTTAAVATGLNVASDVNKIEEARGRVPGGSRLLHYLSPEMTFALPDRPNLELLFRFHHRSGGGDIWGDSELFKGVNGGAQFQTVGFRYRF
jgi:hypothetical protein